jgi:hypothetical protein
MSFSVRTPESCICEMPDALEDLADLKLPEGQADLEASNTLLDLGKAAVKEILESGKLGGEDAGFIVNISGHANEPPAVGDSLSVAITATTPTDPPQRS